MRSALLVISILLVACGSADTPGDAGADAQTPLDAALDAALDPALDGGSRDASMLADAGADADPVDGATECGDAQLRALAAGLLYTSESDYPIDVESFAGAATTAPTADAIATRSGAPTGATIETRTEERFWAAIVVDPTVTPAVPDTRPAELRAAVESLLADRIVVRWIDPAEPAVVRVFLAGRTSCGDLVWLASTAIET